MVSRTQLNQLNLTQQQAVRLAIAEMRKLWTTLNELTPEWQHDLLLALPYQSINPFVDLLYEAADDPDVVSIKITPQPNGTKPPASKTPEPRSTPSPTAASAPTPSKAASTPRPTP